MEVAFIYGDEEGRRRGHSMRFNLELLNGGLGDESSNFAD